MPWHARRHCAVSCAKTAEPIEMPFGLWICAGPRKHVGCTQLAQPAEYDWTVLSTIQPFVKLLWPLVVTSKAYKTRGL